jgi:hypothetical protein
VAETLLEKTRWQQLIVNRQALGNLESSLVCTKVTFCTPVDSRIVDAAYQTLAGDYWRLRSNSHHQEASWGVRLPPKVPYCNAPSYMDNKTGQVP